MPARLDQLPPKTALVEIARDFHARGWMAGTAGNLSARAAPAEASCWITASGLAKGRMSEEDLLHVRVADGEVIERASPYAKPSAETSIHRAIYRLFPAAGACLHVHTVDACIAAQRAPQDARTLALPALEMLKGLGVWEEHPRVDMPLFDNPMEVAHIADAIVRRFEQAPPTIPVLMIRGHGITAWGADVQQAYNHVEIAEFLMSYLARCG